MSDSETLGSNCGDGSSATSSRSGSNNSGSTGSSSSRLIDPWINSSGYNGKELK